MAMREGIETNEPQRFSKEGESDGSIWGSIGGFLTETVGTYAAAERDSWFAREGISQGPASNFAAQDSNAQGDIAGRAQVVQPFYKDPMIIGGGLAVAALTAFFIFRK